MRPNFSAVVRCDRPGSVRRAEIKRALAVFGAVALAIGLISCATNRAVVVPPEIPGAQFVGSETCNDCHGEIGRDFKTATHARLQARGENAAHLGCEGCHGAGSLHNQSGGAAGTIINPRKSADVCFRCHLDKRAEFNLPYHHPVLEGHISCGDCHNPHKGPAIKGGGTSILSENETCFACHTAQRGPFVFEHEATREGCLNCHRPHGSVNQKLLTERNATLCLKCHFQQQSTSGQLLIGGVNHSSFLSRGTCWTAGCHEAVHGSQVNTSLRF